MSIRRHAAFSLVSLALIAGCGSPAVSPTAPPTPAPPAATATLPPTPEPPVTTPEGPAPESPGACATGTVCEGELAAGQYTSTSLGHTIAFEIGPGWRGQPDLPDVGLALIAEDIGAPGGITITWFPGTIFESACDPASTAEIATDAATLIDWIAAHPDLEAGPPEDISVGGLDGRVVDVSASVPPECTEPPWIFLWELPTVGEFHLGDGEQARFIALDGTERTIVIVIETYPGGDHEELLSRAEAIFESMEITPGP